MKRHAFRSCGGYERCGLYGVYRRHTTADEASVGAVTVGVADFAKRWSRKLSAGVRWITLTVWINASFEHSGINFVEIVDRIMVISDLSRRLLMRTRWLTKCGIMDHRTSLIFEEILTVQTTRPTMR